ncbi:MAG: tyrosine-type recombinase/integrase [Candidatus Nanohaloarchaea archaeon]
METQTREAEKMPFQAVKQTNQKLHSNPELSKHNKEVLDEFFRTMQTRGTGESTLKDYASRFNSLAEYIDFKLDRADRRDLENIVAAFNTDNITKRNGEPYSDYSKRKFWKTISVFYNTFIDKNGRGFNEKIDGTELIEDLEISTSIDHDIDLDTRPTPEHIQKVVEQANNLRDRALILFGWATGSRIGELGKTPDHQQHPDPIKWKDLKFKEKEMHVTLEGKTGKRTIPIRVSMPVMKQLFNEENADLADPVFQQIQPRLYCPESGDRVKSNGRRNYENRIYRCISDECEWSGKHTETIKKRKPMKDQDMRKVLRNAVKQAKNKDLIPDSITRKPHWFWRDARALYWAAKDKNEQFLRSFFGWSSTSDAPKHYLETMSESVLMGVREDFGEELCEEERSFNQDSLKPWQCHCGEWVSNIQGYCPECGSEATEELEQHNKPDRSELQEVRDKAERAGYSADEFRDIVQGVLENI